MNDEANEMYVRASDFEDFPHSSKGKSLVWLLYARPSEVLRGVQTQCVEFFHLMPLLEDFLSHEDQTKGLQSRT
jgi:hypothetical protein